MVQLKLTKSQARKLQMGKAVTIKHHQIGHAKGVDVPLSAAQEARLSAAYRRGKGFRLQPEATQLQGGNPFLSILAGLIPSAVEGIINLVKGKGVKEDDNTPAVVVPRGAAAGPRLRKLNNTVETRFFGSQQYLQGSGARLPGAGFTLPGQGLFIPGMAVSRQILKKS